MAVTLCDIRDDTLSVDEVLAAVQDPAAGGTALFVGTIRDHDHGNSVTALDYSHHPSARAVAREVVDGIDAAGRALRIAVLHRVGSLHVGEVAIVAAVSSAHRGEAFEVCREVVDAYKANVPIWKHQHFGDGSDEWVGLP